MFALLWAQGLHWVTRSKRNRKNKLRPLMDKLLLRKRGLLAGVGDQLKNLCQIEHGIAASLTPTSTGWLRSSPPLFDRINPRWA